MSFLVVDELILETAPYRAGHWKSCCGDLDQAGGDNAILPGVHGAIHVALVGVGCHTRFLSQTRVLIVCMTQDHLFHTYGQKCSQIIKCHNIEYNYYTNNVFTD
jgi:hypothetical protein